MKFGKQNKIENVRNSKTSARPHVALGLEQKRLMVWTRCYQKSISRGQKLVKLISFRSGFFDERTNEMKKKNFREKWIKGTSGRNPKASYFMTETLIVQKVAYLLASLYKKEWLSYLVSVLRKVSYSWKKRKLFGNCFSLLNFMKKSRAKNISTSFLA